MQEIFNIVTASGPRGNLIATAVLILVAMVGRSIAMRVVRKTDWGSEHTLLRWSAYVRRLSLGLLIIGLIVIWSSELRTLALSVVALAVAIVIATKELILCLSGSMLRASTDCYAIGDRIEIGGIRGDVVDVGVLTTRVLELGPGHRRSGRSVTIPNSLLLNTPVVNETFTDDFVLHMLSIPAVDGEGWHKGEQRLQDIAREVCAPYVDEARRKMDATSRKHGLPVFSVEPQVNIGINEDGDVILSLRIPCRAREKGAVEQKILRSFLRDIEGPLLQRKPTRD